MSTELNILAEAIADVGYWSWWTGDITSAIQIEFGGTLLWSAPLTDGKPPNSQIALRFAEPSFVAFLSRKVDDEVAPDGWPELMQRDELGNMGLDQDEFTLADVDRLRTIVGQASTVDIRKGDVTVLENLPEGSVFAAFWAGTVGLAVIAPRLKIVNHEGEISLDRIAAMHNKWWEYWKAYWKSKDTDTPMPRDYACEVTIPIGWE